MRNRMWIVWGLVAVGCLEQRPRPGGEGGFEFAGTDAEVPAHPNATSSPDAGETQWSTMPMAKADGGASDSAPSYGALLITELMIDPKARADAAGEWLELFNPTSQAQELLGCTIGDGDGDPRAIDGPLRVEAGAFVTVAGSADPGFDASLVNALSLPNTVGLVELRCGDRPIDRVAYDASLGFPIAAGQATSLDPEQLDADANDRASAWCLARSEFASDLGTPGRANEPCEGRDDNAGHAGEAGATASMPGRSPAAGGAGPLPMSGAAGATAPAPSLGAVAYGALVITEWMADPMARSDAEGEWIELYNASKAPVDLARCALGDGAGAPRAISEHVALAPGEYATLASSANPGFSASLAISLALKNSADVIELDCDGVMVDRVAYDETQAFPVVAGAAASLDPGSLDADANDEPSAWCSASEAYAQDRGTPGAANPSCAGQTSAAPDPEASRPTTTSPGRESEPSAASAPALPIGAVLITELMTDPSARSDADGEWIELYNASAEAIDLAGCAIADGSASPHSITEPLRIEPGGFATIANSADPGFRPSLAGALSLNNSADVVELRCGEAVIDRVAYDDAQGFPLEVGASMALEPGSLSAERNDSAAAWCLATDAYGADRGTPGTTNPPCQPPMPDGGATRPVPAAGPAPTRPLPEPAAAAEPPAPSLPYGAVVITEIMPDPEALSDSRGEWIELYNSTSQSIDLAGCAIGDGTAEPRAITEALRIDAGAYATLAATPDPGFSATAASTLTLRNDADAIELFCGGVLIDHVAYDRSQGFPIAAGASASLDPSNLSADDNDAPSAWCLSTREYATDRGTPGAANAPCAMETTDSAETTANPEPASTPEPQTAADPEPQPAPESGSQAAEPAPEPGSQPADPASQPEEPAPEPGSQPDDPASQPEEAAPEPASQPADPEPQSAPESEPQPAESAPQPAPESETQPMDPEPQPAPDPEPQPVEPDPEPAPEPEPESEAQPEPAADP